MYRTTPCHTRNITVYFIQEVQVWSWSKVSLIMLGQLRLHNLRTTSRSHLVHTVDQMSRDRSCSIVVHQQKFTLKSGTSQAVPDTRNAVPTCHIAVLYTAHDHLPMQLIKCDQYTHIHKHGVTTLRDYLPHAKAGMCMMKSVWLHTCMDRSILSLHLSM